jgi:acyl-CoA synthetase (AMP-forming)/AMP-acid ligase II
MTWLEQIRDVHAGSDRLAVADPSGAVTGRALIGKATAAAEYLTALDVADGCPVPALLTTNADALGLLIGGVAANMPLAPLGPRLTVGELAAMVRGSCSDVLLTETPFIETAQRVAAVTNARVLAVPGLPVSRSGLPATAQGLAFYLHTAGTTGAPKRVAFTQDVLSARTEVLNALVGFGPDHRFATGSPLHHLGGLGNTLVAVSMGAAVLPTTRFSLRWWRGLRRLGATHCLLVPTMIEMLLAENLLDAVGLQTLIYGASPITPETLRRVLALMPGVRLFNLFGQTEGSPITCLDADDHRRAAAGEPHLLSTVGRPVPGLRLRLNQPDASGVGEVLAAAPHLSVHGPDGWLHTGDLGMIDADGYLHLVGRRHDMVIRGGENVYPVEVENVLAAHPGVAAVGVVGVPDPRLGENLAAFVVPADPSRPPDAAELRSFARARLAGFKVPAHWYTVDALPQNSAGKVVRKALCDLHLQGQA